MNIPPEIDTLILSFLGIRPHWRCKSHTRKNMICKNRTKKHQFFCSQHNKIIETQIANYPNIFNTIIIIYSHLWRKKFGYDQCKFNTCFQCGESCLDGHNGGTDFSYWCIWCKEHFCESCGCAHIAPA